MKWLSMLRFPRRRRRRGVLTLEWVLLITVLVIGIIGGLGAVRNAMVGELTDMAEAIEALNTKTEEECSEEGFGSCEAAEEAEEAL